jgi:hypothetical protein
MLGPPHHAAGERRFTDPVATLVDLLAERRAAPVEAAGAVAIFEAIAGREETAAVLGPSDRLLNDGERQFFQAR